MMRKQFYKCGKIGIMSEMNGQFEWSESGRRLLDSIQNIITREGGRHALAIKIMREDKDHFIAKIKAERKREIGEVLVKRKGFFTAKKDQIIIDHWRTHTLQQIADLIGTHRHLSTISLRGYALGLPKRNGNDFVKAQKPRPVIIMYPGREKKCYSITEAANELGATFGYLYKAIQKNYNVKGVKVKFAEEFIL
jgi:hypothetical protein